MGDGDETDKKGLFNENAYLKRYNFDLMAKPDVIDTLSALLARGRLTGLGVDFYVDLMEHLMLVENSHTKIARSLQDARKLVEELLIKTSGKVGYITGGLEARHHQILLDGLVICKLKTFIVGLEEEGYTLGKGRQPLLTFQQRMSLWSMIAPNQSVIFPIPPRPEQISADIYYDWISKTVGVYKNPRVVFVGSQDDPQQIKDAHFRRAFSSQHVLQTSIGIPPVHTTELLKS